MYPLRRGRGPFWSPRRNIPFLPGRPPPRPLLLLNPLPPASLLSGPLPRVVEDEGENDSELTFSFAGKPSFSSAGVAGGASDFVFLDGLLKIKHSLGSLRRTHARLAVGGLLRHLHLGAQLITGYAGLGDLRAARSVFDEIHGSGSFLWNTMARVLARGGCFPETLELYSSMRRAGVPANNYTYPFVLKACASTAAVAAGRSVHGEMLKTGFAADAYAAAALLDMYAKGGEIADGRNVFDGMLKRDLVSWTAMITACEQSEEPEAALLLFQRMLEDEGLAADRVAAISVASAIAQLGDAAAASAARSLHGHALRRGFLEDVSVGNAVLGMHAKCGELALARRLFDTMAERDGISWNSMLSGYAQNGRAGEAMALFDEMLAAGEEPNPVTLLVAASACAQLGSLRLARRLHRVVVLLLGGGVEASAELQSAIMDMYAKCGDLESAAAVFRRSLAAGRGGDVNYWNVMISGFGLHGRGEEALRLFRRMTGGEGVSPDHITLTSLLSACSHAGLVEEGKQIFQEMSEKLAMVPMVKHYACVVDMLGRAGRLEEARDLIAAMPAPPNDAVWGALLGACRIHGNRELAEFAAGNLLQLEPDHSGYYILMSNVYAASTLWPEAGKLRDLMRRRGLKKPAAFSVIEIGREMHGFYTADQGHPERAAIYRKAAALAAEMAAAGYQPDTSCVLHDVEEEDKKTLLTLHSEKLAVAYGLMRLGAAAAAVIRVTMNLRICRDCHSAFRALSLAKGRTIVVRDANRFHHFAGGACSCKDYW